MGTFPGAIDPGNVSFSEFPAFVRDQLKGNEDKKIAMFCTGGIRCEKATVFMKNEGFDNVFQLKGGILRYFQQTDEDTNLWDGDCYVFDDRVALNKNMEPGGTHLLPGLPDAGRTRSIRRSKIPSGMVLPQLC